ncbi:hypothetical protein OOJ91_12520 [Micromonospora lupini]|uniref:hypothetical protein n=1 Tax=Micromonospora lupini TaxID=285679 RepID=UPI00225B4F19|nr:hypothetical protein [Micromonospora lupini]MCX5066704.1 hypothetical protein [Micromonospora lupini]
MTATAEFVTQTAAERFESIVMRWYRVSEFHPDQEWDIFGVVCDVLVMVEEQGIVAFMEAPAQADDAVTRTVWRVLEQFARRAMLLTRTPWTGGQYVYADRCVCTSTDPDGCAGPCACGCTRCR